MNVKKMVLINVVSLVVLVGIGLGIFYFMNQSQNYIKTDFAQIDGYKYTILSPAAGKLTDWNSSNGRTYSKDAVLGNITTANPLPTNPSNFTVVPVTAPSNLTIVSNTVQKDTLVGQGTPLAYAYDFNNLYVTANIDETKINDVEVGQKVDIYVDAFKSAKLQGEVSEIGLSTASEFSLLPQSNTNANYTKVTQVIPVKITIDDAKGYKILPGMNVSVRIHK